MKELRGFSAPEGARGGQPQRRVRRHRSADPRRAVPGRRRRALPRRREAQGADPLPEHRGELGRGGRRASRARWRCSATRAFPSGDWLPYRYLLFPPAIAAARGHDLDERWTGWALAASLWRHYGGEVDTKLAKDAGLAERGDIDGLIEHVKLRAKRPESAVPEEDDLLHNIVGENAILFALLAYFMRVNARSRSRAASCSAARRSRWRCIRSSRARASTAIRIATTSTSPIGSAT